MDYNDKLDSFIDKLNDIENLENVDADKIIEDLNANGSLDINFYKERKSDNIYSSITMQNAQNNDKENDNPTIKDNETGYIKKDSEEAQVYNFDNRDNLKTFDEEALLNGDELEDTDLSSSILLEENRALRKTIEDLKKAKELMAKVVDSEKTKISMLEKDIRNKNTDISKLNDKINEIKTSFERLNNDFSTLNKSNSEITNRLTEANESRSKLSSSLHKEKELNRVLRNKLELYQDEIHELKRTMSQLEPVIDELRNGITYSNNDKILQAKDIDITKTNEFVQLKKEFDNALEEIAKLNKQMEILKIDNSRFSESSKNIENQNIEKIKFLEAQLYNEREKNKILSTEIEKFKINHESRELSNDQLDKIIEEDSINENQIDTYDNDDDNYNDDDDDDNDYIDEIQDENASANTNAIKPISQSKKCPRCGKINLIIAKFCGGCGASFDNIKPIIIDENEDKLNENLIPKPKSKK